MHDAAVHPRKDFLINISAHEDGAGRDEAARERLRHADDVRLDAPMLEGEPLARASETRLHLVGDHERSVLLTEALRFPQKSIGREMHALALDRFKEKRRNVLFLQFFFQLLEAVVMDGRRRKEIAESVAELGVAVGGKRSQGQSVERMVEIENPRASGGAASHLQGAFGGLGAGIREEGGVYLVLDAADDAEQFLRDEPRQQVAVHLDHVRQIHVQEVLDRLFDFRMVATKAEDAVAGEKIQITVALAVVEILTLGALIDLVEADGAQNADELRVDMTFVQRVVLAPSLADHRLDIERHNRCSIVHGCGKEKRLFLGSSCCSGPFQPGLRSRNAPAKTRRRRRCWTSIWRP